MRDKPNEWVSIADLMAGVVAVVMLLFVVAVMQIKEGTGSREACRELVLAHVNKTASVETKIADRLQAIRSAISKQGLEKLIYVDLDTLKITFRENTFESGSACVAESNKGVILEVGTLSDQLLSDISGVEVYVDGHADANVAGISTDMRKCAFYYDNYTLSAGRANEVRRLIINRLTKNEAKNRVIVTGYGESRPVNGLNANDPRNRRVELRFVAPPVRLAKIDERLFKLCTNQ